MDTSKNEKIILVNLDSNNSKKVINYLNKTNQNYYSSNDVEVSRGIIKQKLNQGYKEFIICGGDGSINKFINEYQKLSLNKRKSINLGIIPCGRANDLARALNLPLNTEKAFDIIQNRKTRQIDIIKVNNSVFITGGGLGLPAEIIVDVNKLSKNSFTRIIKKLFGDSIYLWVTLKKFIFGYEGIEDEKNKLLAVYILNQSFIGKNFNLAPEAKNNDGYLIVSFRLKEQRQT
jgi:diacylglycerol kinase family enzyme